MYLRIKSDVVSVSYGSTSISNKNPDGVGIELETKKDFKEVVFYETDLSLISLSMREKILDKRDKLSESSELRINKDISENLVGNDEQQIGETKIDHVSEETVLKNKIEDLEKDAVAVKEDKEGPADNFSRSIYVFRP